MFALIHSIEIVFLFVEKTVSFQTEKINLIFDFFDKSLIFVLFLDPGEENKKKKLTKLSEFLNR